MSRTPVFLLSSALVACQPTQVAQTCPAPAPATAPASMLVTQVLLRRGGSPEGPLMPDYTLSLTASGDALYIGSPRVPVQGQYMGRLGQSAFQRIVADLMARGLLLDQEAKAAPTCDPEVAISIALQTADGRYSGAVFCGHSESESRLARPIYQAIEQIRWYPGARQLALGPAS